MSTLTQEQENCLCLHIHKKICQKISIKQCFQPICLEFHSNDDNYLIDQCIT